MIRDVKKIKHKIDILKAYFLKLSSVVCDGRNKEAKVNTQTKQWSKRKILLFFLKNKPFISYFLWRPEIKHEG